MDEQTNTDRPINTAGRHQFDDYKPTSPMPEQPESPSAPDSSPAVGEISDASPSEGRAPSANVVPGPISPETPPAAVVPVADSFSPTPPFIPPTVTIDSVVSHEDSAAAALANTSKRFLIAYLTTIFSGLVLLWSAIFLGEVIFNYFFGPKSSGSLFDLAGVYIAVISSMVTFGLLYLIASRYVSRSAARDSIGLKDWRVYKLAYALFAALLLVTGASVVAAVVYIPIAQSMIADDLQPKQITVTVLTSIYSLLWIALFLWQERLVKHGKTSVLQGTIVVVAALVVVVLTGIFPIGSKTNDRYDARVSGDLSSIQTKIDDYYTKNTKLPSTLSVLDFKDDMVANRLSNYTYTKDAADATAASSYPNGLYDTTSTTGAMSPSLSATNQYDPSYTTSPTVSPTYKLCATFKTDTTQKGSTPSLLGSLTGSSASSKSTTAGSSASFTDHNTGQVCFDRTSY